MPGSHRPSHEDPSEEGERPETRGTSRLEWVLAAFGALLVLGAVGHLLYEALAEPATPPDVRVEVVGVRPVGGGYLAEFRAENRGRSTAARLSVEGTLRQGATTVETASATLDYLPAEGSRRGGLFFSRDPRAYALDVRAVGYERP